MNALLKFNSAKERYRHLESFLGEIEDNNFSEAESLKTFKLNGYIIAKNHRIAFKNKSSDCTFNFSGKAKPGEVTIITSNDVSISSEILKSLALLYEVTPGTLYFDGYDAMSYPKNQFNQSIAYVDDNPYFPNGPIYDSLERFNCQDPEFSLNYMLAKLDLSYWVRNHDSKLIADSSTTTLETSQLPKKYSFYFRW